jgi:thiosulfate/3-mercaptopyruvate sulfurtransferase
MSSSTSHDPVGILALAGAVVTVAVGTAVAFGLASASGTAIASDVPAPSPAAAVAAQGEAPALVSTEWVAQHRHDPDVLLLHVAMLGMNPPDRFIPGAVLLDYHAIQTSDGLAVELPPVEQLVSVFEASGVSDDVHVVLYGGGAAHIAARAFVTLEYLSHPRVSVMDGGIEAWTHEGRPTTTRPAQPERARFAARVDAGVLADAAWISAHLDDPGVAIIDARPPTQFAGPGNRGLRPGHIPGAGNLYFVELLQSEQLPRLRSREAAEELFAAAGFTPGATVVSYCQIGMRASYNYLIARHLGYDVSLYDGSWQEWGADESLPVETGSGR